MTASDDSPDENLADINRALREQFSPLIRALNALKRTPEYIAAQKPLRDSHAISVDFDAYYKKSSELYDNRPEPDSDRTAYDKQRAALDAEKEGLDKKQKLLNDARDKATAALFKRALQDFPDKFIASAVAGMAIGEPAIDRQFEKMGISTVQRGG